MIKRPHKGATLVELVVSIVIMSITLTATMMVITGTTSASADPMIRAQALAIAEAYMEEIWAQDLNDPDGSETGSFEPGETRASFDDVSDYHGLNDNGVRDQLDQAISQLAGYNVNITVTNTTLTGHAAKKVEIKVTHDGLANFSLPLIAYRLN